MAGTACGVNKLRGKIIRQLAETLDNIDAKQGVSGVSSAADAFEVGAVAGRVLHRAKCHDSRISVDHR